MSTIPLTQGISNQQLFEIQAFKDSCMVYFGLFFYEYTEHCHFPSFEADLKTNCKNDFP